MAEEALRCRRHRGGGARAPPRARVGESARRAPRGRLRHRRRRGRPRWRPSRAAGPTPTSRPSSATCDAVSVAVPTVDHHAVSRRALERGRDVLLEKPMTATLEEADDLLALAAERGAVLQVGHIERFNPATEALLSAGKGARFVEVHRLGSFSPRSLDVDVVLDLMIHDLDIVLCLDGSEPVQIEAVGVPVLTPRVDIANARLRFASRAHREPDRQPGLGREDPEVPGLRPPDLRLGRLHRAGGPGLPPGGGRVRAAPDRLRPARRPRPGAPAPADRGLCRGGPRPLPARRLGERRPPGPGPRPRDPRADG